VDAGILISELKRRRVFRVLVGYGIVSFAVLQVIEPIMHALHLPDVTLTYVVLALAVGFPLVVVLAWAFDIKEGRIERTAPTAGPALKGARLPLLLVGIGIIAAAPGVIWYFVLPGHLKSATDVSGTSAATPSIAVLPFADMSPGKDQEYFSDGIAEEILNALAQVEGLQVTGRTSSFSFKGKNEDLREIGQKLGVGAVLEGSVRKAGNRVRITAQVVKVADGFHVWSQTYDRDLTDIFAVQDEIAKAVVAALRVKLLPSQPAVPEGRRTASTEAYTQFLFGRQFFNRHSPQDYKRSAEAYERAIALDPSYAPAHAGLGLALGYLVNASLSTERNRIEGQQRALAESERAVALAPDLVESYVARGTTRMAFFWDWRGAQADLEGAVARAPGNARAQFWLGHLLAVLGHMPEAMAATRKAIDLDPIESEAWDFLGRYLAAGGDLGRSRAAFEQSLRIAPESIWTRRELAFTYLLGKEPAVALSSFERQQGWVHLMGLALAHHDLGHPKESRKALDDLIALADPPSYQVAQVFAWWGDRDHAFEWLERCRATRDAGVRYVKYDPLLRALRGDARFAAFLRKMNLPPD